MPMESSLFREILGIRKEKVKMIHRHLEHMLPGVNPERAEESARQHIRLYNDQIRHCRKQLRYYRRLRLTKRLEKLSPLLVLLGTVAVFSVFVVLSAL